jgi:excisionase family DNA binding protein
MGNRTRRAAANITILPDPSELGTFPVRDALITPRQAAKILGKSVRTLDRWRAARRIPYVKIGNSISYVSGDILEFIEKSRVRAAA